MILIAILKAIAITLVVAAWAFGSMYWAFRPILQEQAERHNADYARWASERERFKRWNSRHDSSR